MNSSRVNNDDEEVEASLQFTPEETLGYYKDLVKERENEIDELTEKLRNNEVISLKRSELPVDLVRKRQRYVEALENLVLNDQSVDFLAPETNSLHLQVLEHLESQISGMSKIIQNTTEEIARIKKDILYLEEKHSNLEKMKDAAENMNSVVSSSTIDQENQMVKRYFRKVKADLEIVVDTLYPDNESCQALLVDLTKGLLKGGDDVYVDVKPEVFEFVNFLHEADIVSLHPHDRNKVKIVNLL